MRKSKGIVFLFLGVLIALSLYATRAPACFDAQAPAYCKD
jgi:hypothetical protein